MKNFRLRIPKSIVFGPGMFATLGEETAPLGRNALLVTYSDTRLIADALDLARQQLISAGLDTVIFDQVEPNPHNDTCDKGAALARERNCDVVVAFGGGSVIDAAKAIAASAGTGRSCWDFCRHPGGMGEVTAALPIAAVPTTSATGSEANGEAVITNGETNEKCVMASPLITPRVAVCDPELHLSLPKEATADGCVDILSHCLEGYLSGDGDCSVQDRITEGLIGIVLEWGPIAVADGQNLRARRELQYAGLLAISEVAHAGRGGTWLMHNIEHALSGHYDVPHGRGMAVMIPRVMRFFRDHVPGRLAQLGERCFGIDSASVEDMAGETVDTLVRWLARIRRDLTLGDIGIGDEKFEAMAGDVIRNDGDGMYYYSVVPLDREGVMAILGACLVQN